MRASWHRLPNLGAGYSDQISDHIKPVGESSLSEDYLVTFVADAPIAVVSCIRLSINKYYNLFYVSLIFSPYYYTELKNECARLGISYKIREGVTKVFDESGSEKFVSGTFISAEIRCNYNDNNTKEIEKLIRLFTDLNLKIQPRPFPDELLSDLGNIYLAATKGSVATLKFNIPVKPQPKTEYRKASGKRFVDLLKKKPVSGIGASNDLISGLLEGEDPNEPLENPQYNIDKLYPRHNPLSIAILRHESLKPTELLLWYKANPFSRLFSPFDESDNSQAFGLSPFELAMVYGFNEKADLIVREFTPIERNPPPFKLAVVKTDIRETADNHVLSEFELNNSHTIRTILKPVSELNEKERKAIYDLFEDCFEVPSNQNNEDVKKIFDDDFSPTSNRLIDVIYDGDDVIGFNLLELVRPKKDEKNIYLHCFYGAIKKDYRSYGLMTFLAFRFGYILQSLLPEYQVGIFFNALDYSSYSMVNFPHFPKYQTDEIREKVKSVIDTIWEGDYFYFHEKRLATYIHERLRVKSAHRKHDGKLNERVFRRDLLELDDDENSEQPRGVPIVYMITKENYEHIRKVAESRNIKFDDHIVEYAAKMERYIKPYLSTDDKIEINLKNLTRSGFAFFNIHSAFPESRAEIPSLPPARSAKTNL